MENKNLIELIINNKEIAKLIDSLSCSNFNELLNESNFFDKKDFKKFNKKHPNLEQFEQYILNNFNSVHNLNHLSYIYNENNDFFNDEVSTYKILIKYGCVQVIKDKNLLIDHYFTNEEIIKYQLDFYNIRTSNNYFEVLLNNFNLDGTIYTLKNILELSNENISKYIKNVFSKADRDTGLDEFISTNYHKVKENFVDDIFEVMLENKSLISINTIRILSQNQINVLKEKFPDHLYYFFPYEYYSLTTLPKYKIINEYDSIRECVMNCLKNDIKRVGKQGLKYFLIKNKQKLDKEFLLLVLNKYPQFYDSLKVNYDEDIINLLNSKSNKNKKNLKEVFFKNDKYLSLNDRLFIQKNINILLSLKSLDYINQFSKDTLKYVLDELN